jgi:S-adenosylmethionine:tRNA ribosyltransferase-isomerase
MLTDNFDYNLPEELIAQHPPEIRGDSRMLVLHRQTGLCEIKHFNDLPNYLEQGDCLVFNNTRVMSARMYGVKYTANAEGATAGAKIEILLISATDSNGQYWQCLLRPGKRVKEGTRIKLSTLNEELENEENDWFTVQKKNDDGTFEIKFDSSDVWQLQEKYGHVPLPPYIKREDVDNDHERYQTIFATTSGAVAAPTAGLHFTDETMALLKNKGVINAEVTLHVGPGTFQPVSVEDVENHQMHSEEFMLTEQNAEIINQTHQAGKKVLAVGTTSVRVLESCADFNGNVHAQTASTDIFIYPPYKPKAVDMLLTNFHLPKSTLLMLVSAFASRQMILEAYEIAKQEKFRFYSYGDCMLII